jgi:hypothetical protein
MLVLLTVLRNFSEIFCGVELVMSLSSILSVDLRYVLIFVGGLGVRNLFSLIEFS